MKQKGIVSKIENPTSSALNVVFEDGKRIDLLPQGILQDSEGIHLANLDEVRGQGAKITFNLTEIL